MIYFTYSIIEAAHIYQISRRQIHTLEDQVQAYVSREHKLNSHVRTLELERTALLIAVTKLRTLVPPDLTSSIDVETSSHFSAASGSRRSPIYNPLAARFVDDPEISSLRKGGLLTELEQEVTALRNSRRSGVNHISITSSFEDTLADLPTTSDC